MRNTETAVFAVTGSKSFHKLELSKALLRFVEFDFTYFWEQCIEAGRNARKTGRIARNMENMAMNALVKCHPYVEACASTEFSSVVLDCIIAYICHSEGIGLEELWARCISPKSLYEKAIFNRVSEYKTGRGINQWINIVRMQEYARSKIKFIYECDSNVMLRPEDYRTRTEYFDLAFSVAANETGCPMDKLPSVKMYTPSTLPDSVFMMGRMSKNIYRRLSDVLRDAEMWDEKTLNDHNRDQTALDAFSYVKDMPRPAENDMRFALEAVSELPDTVYVPDSFKAMIDLEFTLMSQKGIYMSKCPRCGRFFVRELDERSPYCHRVNSSGMTCAEQINEELGIAAMKRGEAPVTEEKPVSETSALENEPAVGNENAEEAAAENVSQPGSVSQPEPAPQVKPEPPKPVIFDEKPQPIEIPKELEKRCQRVYNMLYKRIGTLMTEKEFREWSGYLSDTKRDLREGNAELSQMEEFLDYWETAVKKQSRKSRRHKEDIYDTAPYPETVPVQREDKSDNELSSIFDEAVKAAEDKEDSGISPAGTEAAPEERSFKPFNPPKYSTVLEAMMDGKYKSEELLSDSSGDSAADGDITVNGKKITLPNWERITRE
ncbi:MAG: hypothetical protein PUI48_01990 [Oscillospiraceae bacterium]|nr:hypothetical protein [Oscillospiraceae bacterium]MDY6209414.1 hypothetical protein [Oscillospiraceae bacterium]